MEQLPGITAKTLVISGEEDIIFSHRVSASRAEAIDGATFSMIEQAAHSIHMEQPQMFTNHVLNFLLSKKVPDRKSHQ